MISVNANDGAPLHNLFMRWALPSLLLTLSKRSELGDAVHFLVYDYVSTDT